MRRVWARLRRRNRGSSWPSESFGMASTGVGWDGFLVMAFSFGVFAALCTIGEYKGRGKSRCTQDRKSTRLNSSHQIISYAVFCLKKKKEKQNRRDRDVLLLR